MYVSMLPPRPCEKIRKISDSRHWRPGLLPRKADNTLAFLVKLICMNWELGARAGVSSSGSTIQGSIHDSLFVEVERATKRLRMSQRERTYGERIGPYLICVLSTLQQEGTSTFVQHEESRS